MSASRKIEITEHPERARYRGAKLILVDGEKWGTIEMRSIGPRGVVYEFLNADHHFVRVKSYVDHKKLQHYAEVKVYSDKIARDRENNLAPLAERLLDKARELVESKLLLSPATLKAEALKRESDYKAQQQKRARERLELLGGKADECLDRWPNRTDMREAIIEAMKWAQSQ